MAERRCETCRFWDNGNCRRYPPQWTGLSRTGEKWSGTVIRPVAGFPHAAASDWCGEHMPKIKGGEAP